MNNKDVNCYPERSEGSGACVGLRRFFAALRMTFCFVLVTALRAGGQEAEIRVHVKEVTNRITPWTTGACIEDVNHEIYGGIYSQMIFGESFQEPALSAPPKGFTAYGGEWLVKDGELFAGAGDGPKLICDEAAFSTGEASVEVLFPDARGGNASMIV